MAKEEKPAASSLPLLSNIEANLRLAGQRRGRLWGNTMLKEQRHRMKWRMLALILLFILSTFAWGQTNRSIIGVFPFENLSAETGHDGWSKWLPEILQGRNDEGLKWLLAAAKQGDPLAQAEGGRNLLLLRGPSAGPDAVDLLRKAAGQDCVKAYYPLAMLLYEGKGVTKDEVEATMWAHLGSIAGDSNCRSLLKEIQLFADPASFAQGGKKAQERLAQKPK